VYIKTTIADDTKFCKNLFGQPDENDISLVESRIDDIPQVTDAKNDILVSAFTETEVKEVVSNGTQ
jgi:hypothetical protein